MSDHFTVGQRFMRPVCRAVAAAINRYLLPAPALSSKPAGRSAAVVTADRRDCCCLILDDFLLFSFFSVLHSVVVVSVR